MDFEIVGLPGKDPAGSPGWLNTSTESTQHDFPVEQCARSIVGAYDSGGIAKAAQAIDVFTAGFNGRAQLGALHALEQEIIFLLRSASGEWFDFVNNVIEVIDARLRASRVRLNQETCRSLATDHESPSVGSEQRSIDCRSL